MKSKLTMSFAVAVLGLAFSGLALAQGSIIKIQSQHNFSQTVSNIQSATSQHGWMVMGHLNQGQALSTTGLRLKGESFFVGDPNGAKELFTVEPAVGVIAPLRIFVYEGSDGHTYVSYEKPSARLDQLNNPEVSMMTKIVDMKIQAIAQAATH
ncbi:MAG: DUF302 domain-containing protein [Terriglobia bacterium]